MKKLRVGVIYGGRSGEHEVSVASAAAVFANLDRARYDAIPIRIDRDGRWSIPDRPPIADSAAAVIASASSQPPRSGRSNRQVLLPPHSDQETLLSLDRLPDPDRDGDRALVSGIGLDVMFPVLHGPYGEDGTIQGLLEVAGVPYVGAGVLASAVGMDKPMMKAAFAFHGLPIVDHQLVCRHQWRAGRDGIIQSILSRATLPVFVKPANLGSSVGISKAGDPDALATALDLAAEYDRRIIVEAAVPDAREIECGVIGNDHPEASVPGEIRPAREFYDYEAKYLDSGSELLIPAPLPDALATRIREVAIQAFTAVDGAGMARVDFLLSRSTSDLYLNEINTIPGFTTISMFAKLWAASGLDYPALLDRLITLAVERHADSQERRLNPTASLEP